MGAPTINSGSLTGVPSCSDTFFYSLTYYEIDGFNLMDPQPSFATFIEDTLSFDLVAVPADEIPYIV